MTDDNRTGQDPAEGRTAEAARTGREDRRRREALALRANLARRKARARALRPQDDEPDGN